MKLQNASSTYRLTKSETPSGVSYELSEILEGSKKERALPPITGELTRFQNRLVFISSTGRVYYLVFGKKGFSSQGKYFHVQPEEKRWKGSGADLDSAGAISTKMPGKILKIKVSEGSPVEKGDSLLVMEAMKMENEIKTLVSGTVREIKVQEGEAVEAGSLLVVIDPA